MADDLVNYLVTVVCSLIIGAACHSFWGHWMQRRAAEAEYGETTETTRILNAILTGSVKNE